MNKLGIDFGKVIIGATLNGVHDTSFLGSTLAAAMKTPAAEGAFDAVKELVSRFRGQVWIVSKCGPTVEKKSRAWLDIGISMAIPDFLVKTYAFAASARTKRQSAGNWGSTTSSTTGSMYFRQCEVR
ncbi:MAG: hypothetical protein JKY56_13815 [Kofleriaceae bacterium]|nr:hypothetical protein [Kofleriaceae bacterium]